jgi:GntR family transcriptional regulator
MQQRAPERGRQAAPVDWHIEADSFVPYYQQIIEQFRGLVKSGVLREGDVFHSEGDVAAALNISKMPVRQAFLKLRSEGLLIIEKGKRPVVGTSQVPWNFQQLRGFSEEMRRRGLIPSAKVLRLVKQRAEPDIAAVLRLEAGASVYLLKRLRFVNEEPVAIVTSFIPSEIFPDLDRQNLEKQSLYSIFEKTYRRQLSWADEEIGATTATASQARMLDTRAGKPLLSIRETTFDSKRIPVEYSHSLLRADRYTANVTSVRKR